MKINFSNSITPTHSEKWVNSDDKKRKELIMEVLNKSKLYEGFQVVDTPKSGQVVLRIEKNIPVSQRGLLLLELEKKIKSAIDLGLTIWCEPVGDKSKLRKLKAGNSIDSSYCFKLSLLQCGIDLRPHIAHSTAASV